MRRLLVLTIVSFALALAIASAPVRGKVEVYTDPDGFRAATGPLTELDFEDHPVADPAGSSFHDAFGPEYGFCSHPTCQPDPDNADGGNVEIFLNHGAYVSFAVPPQAVMVIVEGIGDNPFTLKVSDVNGEATNFDGRGVSYGVTYAGFASVARLSEVLVVSVGGTGGPIVFSAILYGDLRQPEVAGVGPGNSLATVGVAAAVVGGLAVFGIFLYRVRSRRE